MSEPRSFSKVQRSTLYQLAGGTCEICGCDLEDDWHADHIIPHSEGGETIIANGQALCPSCNQSKSDSFMIEFPGNDTPRAWQSDFVRDYVKKDQMNYLLAACPGSGKSWAAASVAGLLFKNAVIDRVIAFSPSEEKRKEWANDLSLFGVETTPKWSGRKNPPDANGISVTYHWFDDWLDNLKVFASKPCLVIFDEIHHLAKGRYWGEKARSAFRQPSARTLGLTGTPFRSDNYQIPFINYDSAGRAKVDWEYSYGDALKDDGVVRNCHFKKYGGRMRWDSPTTGEKEEHTFEEDLSDDLQSQRLQTAINPELNYLRAPLQDAHQRLERIRETHQDAGGLIVAKNTHQILGTGEYDTGLIDLVRDVAGHEPVVVKSDDYGAHDKIDEFRNSTDRWVIAIKMISEGVDIKRLRVGLYASHITTRMFIHQVVGRVIRTIDGRDDRSSWFYFPRDPRIVPAINNIEKMMRHEIEKTQEEEGGPQSTPEDPEPFVPISGEATDYDLTSTQMEQLRQMPEEKVLEQDEEIVKEYLRRLREEKNEPTPAVDLNKKGNGHGQPVWQKKEEIRTETLPKKISKIVGARWGGEIWSKSQEVIGEKHAVINAEVNKRLGLEEKDRGEWSLQQLERAESVAERLLKKYKQS